MRTVKENLRTKTTAVLAPVLLLTAVCSCGRDQLFEKEQYKHVFSLVSHEDTYNVYNAVVHLGRETTERYVTAHVGGTTPGDRTIEVDLEEDEELLQLYPRALKLPSRMYRIPEYSLTIPAGEREGRMKIELSPEGLSPDSAYFIPLKVHTYRGGELNPRKTGVLYRVLLENRYASQSVSSIYLMEGVITIAGKDARIQAQKSLAPLGRRKVRTAAGIRIVRGTSPAQQLAFVRNECIVLEVTDQVDQEDNRRVRVLPVSENISVTQLDNDPRYPNVFKITTDIVSKREKQYKTFLIHYRYTLQDGTTEEVREMLRLEFKPEKEKEEDFM